MKTNQIVKALDLSDVLVRTMDEKFTQRILQACFACMNMGTDEDAKRLSKPQKKIRYSMMSPVVRDFREKLVRIARQSMAGSSIGGVPPPPPPYPSQPDELPTIPPSVLQSVHRIIEETLHMASIKRRLEEFKQT